MSKDKKHFHENLFLETEQGPFLIGKKCRKCGNVQFPQKNFCEKCLSKDIEDVSIGQRGKLFSYTTTYGKAANFDSPFSTGYIELPEGLRIFAPLRTEENQSFKTGAEMELEIAELWEEDGVAVTGYRYKLADKERRGTGK